MPTYCFTGIHSGETIERSFPMGKAPDEVVGDDEVFKRNLCAEIVTQSASVVGSKTPVKRTWPMTCCASGVNAAQAGDLRKHLREKGVPTEVTSDGDPVYMSAAHRRKALRVRGMVDKSSFS